MIGPWDAALRLLISAVAGGMIGYQRERADRPAGFRTHVLVSAGSALFMLISVTPLVPGLSYDPSRIAAGVVTGIGFLGAGTIIRQGSVVVGLTTAASLWAVSAVGLAAGAGLYWLALWGTILILLSLTLFKFLETRLIAKRAVHNLSVVANDQPGQLGRVDSVLSEMSIHLRKIELGRQEGKAVMHLSLELPPDILPQAVFEKVAALSGIIEVHWD